MTGDDHNTDALIAALRSPALPAERAGEAAAVTAMLGVLARHPASTRFRAGRGIAIAVVTVASLGVGGLAAAGPGVFQAAAGKARSLVTSDSADTDGRRRGERRRPAQRLAARRHEWGRCRPHGVRWRRPMQQAAASVDCSSAPCGVGTSTRRRGDPDRHLHRSAPTATTATRSSPVANGSVPPSAEEDHDDAVTDAAHDAVHPADGAAGQRRRQGGTNPNQPEVTPGGPPSSTPANSSPAGRQRRPSPRRRSPLRPSRRRRAPPTGPPISTPGSGNGQGTGTAARAAEDRRRPRNWRRPGPAGQGSGGQGGQSRQGRRQRGLIGGSPTSVDAVSIRDPHHTGHRSIRGGLARAAVFGASDGLVSNVSLLLGFAGSGVAVGVVRLAGLAGAVAGGISMAAGEWVSVSSQNDLIRARARRRAPRAARQPRAGDGRAGGDVRAARHGPGAGAVGSSRGDAAARDGVRRARPRGVRHRPRRSAVADRRRRRIAGVLLARGVPAADPVVLRRAAPQRRGPRS